MINRLIQNNRLYYGWILVAVGWLCYGFGISPGFYSWGMYSKRMIEEFGLSRTEFGLVFTIFTLLYNSVSPLTGLAIDRWGLRVVMVVGSLISAAGFLVLSRADSLMACFIGFGVLVGAGVGISTIVPGQTLGSNWFIRYRARAIAIIFTAGGVVGKLIGWMNHWMLENATWREGWLTIAGISLAVAVLAAIFIRNQPEDVGLLPDGRKRVGDGESAPMARTGATSPDATAPRAQTVPVAGAVAPSAPLPGSTAATVAASQMFPNAEDRAAAKEAWTARRAIVTPQFFLITACAVAYAVPWGVVVNHGQLHLSDIGLPETFAATIIGTMALVSVLGRFAGGLGDFLPSRIVLALSLALEGAGLAGLIFFQTQPILYASFVLIGLGFGTAYISVPVVFSEFFGRRAFATSAGMRLLIVGLFNAAGPVTAGAIADATGSYIAAFWLMVGLCIGGVVCALLARDPGLPAHAPVPQSAPA